MKGIPDRIRDGIIKNDIDISRLEETVRLKITHLLDLAQREIIGNLANEDLTSWKRERLSSISQTLDRILTPIYGEVKKVSESSLRDVAEFASEITPKILNGAVGANLFDVTLTPEFLQSAVKNSMIDGHIIGAWWDKQAEALKEKTLLRVEEIGNQINAGLIKGNGISEIISAIRGQPIIFGKDGQLATSGLIGISKREATAIVSTSTMQVLQGTRLEVYRQNEDILRGYQWVSTLDARTTPLCRALDGREYDLNFRPVGHSIPYPGCPAHWSCRSSIIPLTKGYEELMDILPEPKQEALKDIPPSQRASMGGVTKAKDYGEWLRDQPEDVQIDVLGETRHDLWKTGKIGMSDLIHQSGRQLTLDELRERYGKK